MIWFWHRILSDFWPIDKSTVAPNIFAAFVQWIIVGAVLYLVWPRFRKAIDGWVKGHLHRYHTEHVGPAHDALHEKLDRVIGLLSDDKKEETPCPTPKTPAPEKRQPPSQPKSPSRSLTAKKVPATRKK